MRLMLCTGRVDSGGGSCRLDAASTEPNALLLTEHFAIHMMPLPSAVLLFWCSTASVLQVVQHASDTIRVVDTCVTTELLKSMLPHLLEQLELCQKSLSAYLGGCAGLQAPDCLLNVDRNAKWVLPLVVTGGAA